MVMGITIFKLKDRKASVQEFDAESFRKNDYWPGGAFVDTKPETTFTIT